MSRITDQKSERQYYIDWLRILLILSVFLFHIGMIFNTWPWHVKNDQQYGGVLKQIMIFLHNWRMPLLFMLSGAGTFFALGIRTPGQYLFERFKRLLIPLAGGIFILVPVQVYIEKISQFSSLKEFYMHMFDGIYPEGNFSWHHLWFIAYLFVIALFISPFLNFMRSRCFENFRSGLEKIVTKPLTLNIFLIPLLLSQILLRPFFETETGALLDDWASMTFYIIFFLAGFILLPSANITEAMRKYRALYLSEVIVVAIIMFSLADKAESERSAEIAHDIASIVLSWSCAITAIGFARQYMNKTSKMRKRANEAIYPFYLLHQPVIVVTGYFTVHLEVPALLKVIIVLTVSFSLTVIIYWFLIRPYNLTRVIFGMKKMERKRQESGSGLLLQPIEAKIKRSLPGKDSKSI